LYVVAGSLLFVNHLFTDPQCNDAIPLAGSVRQMQPRSLPVLESAVKQTVFSLVHATPLREIEPVGAPAGGMLVE
jgi:hypothetical protein